MPQLDLLDERVRNLQRDVEGHGHDLYGNGDKGLKSRMQSAEMWIEDQKRTQLRREENLQRALYAALGTIIVGVLVWIGATVFEAVKRDATLNVLERATSQLESVVKTETGAPGDAR